MWRVINNEQYVPFSEVLNLISNCEVWGRCAQTALLNDLKSPLAVFFLYPKVAGYYFVGYSECTEISHYVDIALLSSRKLFLIASSAAP